MQFSFDSSLNCIAAKVEAGERLTIDEVNALYTTDLKQMTFFVSIEQYLENIECNMKSTTVFVIAFLIGLAFRFIDLGTVATHALVVPFPNERPGYEFFGKGNLNPVEFGVSKKPDIERMFGSTCEKSCDFDERFTIKFNYLSCDDCMTTEHVRDRAVCPLSEYMGTIEKITLTPKVPVQFEKVPTSMFPKHTGGSIWFKDGSGAVSYESFGDEFGLKYSIKQSSTSKVTLTSPAPAFVNGQLYSIDYGLSTELETKIFKAEYNNCTMPNRAN